MGRQVRCYATEGMLRVATVLFVLTGVTACGDSEELEKCGQTLHRLGACVRTWGPDVLGDGEWSLTVVGLRQSTDRLCWVPDSLDLSRAAIPFEVDLEPTRGWELTDEAGDRWIVEFAFPSMPENLLLPGDNVIVAYSSQDVPDLAYVQRGYVTIRRDMELLAFYARRTDPQDVPGVDLSLKVGRALCTSKCWERVNVQIEADGHAKTLATGERARIGEMQVMNDYYGFSHEECGMPDTSLGAYRTP